MRLFNRTRPTTALQVEPGESLDKLLTAHREEFGNEPHCVVRHYPAGEPAMSEPVATPDAWTRMVVHLLAGSTATCAEWLQAIQQAPHDCRIEAERDLELILRHQGISAHKAARAASHYFNQSRMKGEL